MRFVFILFLTFLVCGPTYFVLLSVDVKIIFFLVGYLIHSFKYQALFLLISYYCREFKQRVHAVVKALQSCIPLIIVGAARTVSVKATDYQEHVSEYGVHWNFFFTLAVVKVSNDYVT